MYRLNIDTDRLSQILNIYTPYTPYTHTPIHGHTYTSIPKYISHI